MLHVPELQEGQLKLGSTYNDIQDPESHNILGSFSANQGFSRMKVVPRSYKSCPKATTLVDIWHREISASIDFQISNRGPSNIGSISDIKL
jgi:hypothetical protein